MKLDGKNICFTILGFGDLRLQFDNGSSLLEFTREEGLELFWSMVDQVLIFETYDWKVFLWKQGVKVIAPSGAIGYFKEVIGIDDQWLAFRAHTGNVVNVHPKEWREPTQYFREQSQLVGSKVYCGESRKEARETLEMVLEELKLHNEEYKHRTTEENIKRVKKLRDSL